MWSQSQRAKEHGDQTATTNSAIQSGTSDVLGCVASAAWNPTRLSSVTCSYIMHVPSGLLTWTWTWVQQVQGVCALGFGYQMELSHTPWVLQVLAQSPQLVFKFQIFATDDSSLRPLFLTKCNNICSTRTLRLKLRVCPTLIRPT